LFDALKGQSVLSISNVNKIKLNKTHFCDAAAAATTTKTTRMMVMSSSNNNNNK